MWSVTVQTTGATLIPGNPIKLFDTAPYAFPINSRTYDVSSDGQRFLMIKNASDSNATATLPSLVVVEHWTEELKARLGTK